MHGRYNALKCLAILALSPVWSCSSTDGGAGREVSPAAGRAGAGGDAGGSGVTGTGGTPVPGTGGVPFPAVTLPGGAAGTGGQGGKPDVLHGECAQFNFESARKPAEVLLLLDRSASMDENDIAPGLTRWEGVIPLVNQAVTATDATVSWGLKTFPEAKDNECEASSVTSFIDVPIAPLNASTVVSQVNQTLPDGDGTPTGPALAAAVTYLSSRASDRKQFICSRPMASPRARSPGKSPETTLARTRFQARRRPFKRAFPCS